MAATRITTTAIVIVIGICLVLTSSSQGFAIRKVNLKSALQDARMQQRLAASRYGPPIGGDIPPNDNISIDLEQQEWERQEAIRVERQSVEFRDLLHLVLITTNPDHLPSLLTKHTKLLFSMRGEEVAKLVENIMIETPEYDQERVGEAIDYILSFVEEFADQAKSIDDKNKKILGKIIRMLADKETTTGRDREELLDELMRNEKQSFTRGFLRHIEGECERIASAPQMTPQSSRLLEILRIIQTRVLEESGKDLGEGALVLGQLLGYDDKQERLAILDAGLTVRGIDFAYELTALTEEALKGFAKVPGGVDPGLVQCIQEVDERVRSFINKNNEFQ